MEIVASRFIYSALGTSRNLSTKTIPKTTRKSIGLEPNSFSSNKRVLPIKPDGKIQWTDQQSQVLAAVSDKKSVFITGSAGTGKSFLLKHVIKLLNAMYGPSGVFVTAPTGVAACAIKGRTLHSFAGIGPRYMNRESLLRKVVSDRRAYKRWKKVKALVIDEISMVQADFFDDLNYIAKETRPKYRKKVWGGIQLIVSGDFFQLPPIIDQECSSDKEFAFEADCWNSSFDFQVELTKIFRQTDSRLVNLLQGIRRGKTDANDLQLLRQCSSENELDPSVVRLYPRNEDVERVNKDRLRALGREIVSYQAVDTGDDKWRRRLKQGLAPDKLDICIGARVMLIKNVNTSLKLVNGSAGTVVDLVQSTHTAVRDVCSHGLLPVVKFDTGREVIVDPDTFELMDGDMVLASRKQVPLILAWALSIHKCQGMTLGSLHTDLSRAFGCGMVYVALSRVMSLDGLYLSGLKPSKIKAHPKVLEYYRNFSRERDMEVESDYGVAENSLEVETCCTKVSNFWKKNNARTVIDFWEDRNVGMKYYLTSTNFRST